MTSELREKAELAVRKYRDEIEMHDGLSNYKTAVHFAAEMLREREDKERAIELIMRLRSRACLPSDYSYPSGQEVQRKLLFDDPKENQQ